MSSSDTLSKPTSKLQPKKTPSSSAAAASTRPPQDQQTLKCPRCNSPNTKFCYYNNYSLSQPRHFCKTCRRYWTKGGALRNVPVGGGCRKSKKLAVKPPNISSSCSSASRMFSLMDDDSKLFHGLVSPAAMEFGGTLSLSRLISPSLVAGGSIYNNNNNNLQLSSCMGDQSVTSDGGFGNNYPLSSASTGFSIGSASMDVNGNIASSIETLSSLNQDLHWKLQQQRMATLFGHNQQKDINHSCPDTVLVSAVEKPQPILFQNLKESASVASNREAAATSTEWLFGNFAHISSVSSSSHIHVGVGNDSGNVVNDGGNDWHGMQGWGDMNQYNGLP